MEKETEDLLKEPSFDDAHASDEIVSDECVDPEISTPTSEEHATEDAVADEPEAIAKETDSTAVLSKSVTSAVGGILIKKSYIAIALTLVAVLTVGSLFLGMWISKSQNSNRDGIDPGAKDHHSIYANAGGADSDEITVPGYSNVFFPADERNVQIVLLNPDHNPCYFRFILILSETNEEIYRSGLIPPGMAVTDIELDRALQAGEYSLCIRIESFSLVDRSAMNGANVETTLTVSK